MLYRRPSLLVCCITTYVYLALHFHFALFVIFCCNSHICTYHIVSYQKCVSIFIVCSIHKHVQYFVGYTCDVIFERTILMITVYVLLLLSLLKPQCSPICNKIK